MPQGKDVNKSDRENARRKTLLGGVLFDENSKKWECKVSNLSETGALLKTKANLKSGSFIEVKINKFNDLRRAEVVWVSKEKCGVEFAVKIDKFDPAVAELFKLLKTPRDY